jgi:hypothetical protein
LVRRGVDIKVSARNDSCSRIYREDDSCREGQKKQEQIIISLIVQRKILRNKLYYYHILNRDVEMISLINTIHSALGRPPPQNSSSPNEAIKEILPHLHPRKSTAFVENALVMVGINPEYSARGPRSLAMWDNSGK